MDESSTFLTILQPAVAFFRAQSFVFEGNLHNPLVHKSLDPFRDPISATHPISICRAVLHRMFMGGETGFLSSKSREKTTRWLFDGQFSFKARVHEKVPAPQHCLTVAPFGYAVEGLSVCGSKACGKQCKVRSCYRK